MEPLVAPQVDQVERVRRPRHHRLAQLALRSGNRVDAAVVLGVRVDVEDLGMCAQSRAKRIDHALAASLREVGDAD